MLTPGSTSFIQDINICLVLDMVRTLMKIMTLRSHFRTISLMSHVMKALIKKSLDGNEKKLKAEISENRSGFLVIAFLLTNEIIPIAFIKRKPSIVHC